MLEWPQAPWKLEEEGGSVPGRPPGGAGPAKSSIPGLWPLEPRGDGLPWCQPLGGALVGPVSEWTPSPPIQGHFSPELERRLHRRGCPGSPHRGPERLGGGGGKGGLLAKETCVPGGPLLRSSPDSGWN